MKAYEVIEKYGWIQHSYGNTKKGFCVLGALLYASCFHRHARALWEHLGLQNHTKIEGVFEHGYLSQWNDDPKRTKRQVIKMLKTIEEGQSSAHTRAQKG